MKYTINIYTINGKFTAMQPFLPMPILFDNEEEALEYAKIQGEDTESISIEEYNPEEWEQDNE